MQRRRARMLQFMLVALAATSSVACRTASYQSVPGPAATLDESKCRVYICRSSQLWGKIRQIEVIDRGTMIGSLGTEGYLCWDREPGENPIQVLYHGPILDEGVLEGLLAFNGEAGGVYYYAVHLRESDRKPQMELLSAEDGMAMMAGRSQATID
ncbi:MAG: hypothetical protein ACI8QZ_000811 [Chlamydiales bacterium]|jgi:hypothetical protein